MRNFDKTHIPKPHFVQPIPSGFSFLDIEIGCGVGFHPIDYAKNNPNRLLIAIEKTAAKFAKFERRTVNHPHLNNVVPIHSNAIWWITHYVQPHSVDRYFILYPNPYPKDPQKRFFQMPFMGWLKETMKDGATLTFATNEKFYMEEAIELGTQVWKFKLKENRIINSQEKPRTHFEKKYLSRGESCYNVIFEK